MTIQFKDYPSMKEFCNSCLFVGDCPDNTLPVFDTIEADFNYKQVRISYPNGKTAADVKKVLRQHRIAVQWVNEY